VGDRATNPSLTGTIGTVSKKGRRGAGKDGGADNAGDAEVSVNQRVRVYVDTDAETRGVVVDDFGDDAGHSVDVLDSHFVDPARRWAVLLDDGTLVFVDSHQLAAE